MQRPPLLLVDMEENSSFLPPIPDYTPGESSEVHNTSFTCEPFDWGLHDLVDADMFSLSVGLSFGGQHEVQGIARSNDSQFQIPQLSHPTLANSIGDVAASVDQSRYDSDIRKSNQRQGYFQVNEGAISVSSCDRPNDHSFSAIDIRSSPNLQQDPLAERRDSSTSSNKERWLNFEGFMLDLDDNLSLHRNEQNVLLALFCQPPLPNAASCAYSSSRVSLYLQPPLATDGSERISKACTSICHSFTFQLQSLSSLRVIYRRPHAL